MSDGSLHVFVSVCITVWVPTYKPPIVYIILLHFVCLWVSLSLCVCMGQYVCLYYEQSASLLEFSTSIKLEALCMSASACVCHCVCICVCLYVFVCHTIYLCIALSARYVCSQPVSMAMLPQDAPLNSPSRRSLNALLKTRAAAAAHDHTHRPTRFFIGLLYTLTDLY